METIRFYHFNAPLRNCTTLFDNPPFQNLSIVSPRPKSYCEIKPLNKYQKKTEKNVAQWYCVKTWYHGNRCKVNLPCKQSGGLQPSDFEALNIRSCVQGLKVVRDTVLRTSRVGLCTHCVATELKATLWWHLSDSRNTCTSKSFP